MNYLTGALHNQVAVTETGVNMGIIDHHAIAHSWNGIHALESARPVVGGGCAPWVIVYCNEIRLARMEVSVSLGCDWYHPKEVTGIG